MCSFYSLKAKLLAIAIYHADMKIASDHNKLLVRLADFVIAITLGLIILLRLQGGLFRIPPDPGYYMFDEARNAPLWKIFSYNSWDGYISIIPRITATLTVFFPLTQTALVASLITVAIWVLTGLCLFHIVLQESKSRILSLMACLMVALVPAASESSIGNFGNTKWQLFILTAVICASPHFFLRFNRLSILLILISGLSNILNVLATIPLLVHMMISKKNRSRQTFLLATTSLLTFAVQIFAFQLSGASGVRIGIVRWKFGVFPIFWDFNFIFPALLALLVILISVFEFRKHVEKCWQPVALSATSLSVWFVCYSQGGLADRYFVAPTVISWIALILAFAKRGSRIPSLYKLVFGGTTCLMAAAAVVWFPASSYLRAGPSWKDEVVRTSQICSVTHSGDQEVNLSIGSTSVRCSDLSGE
jgi:hypothetical protein